MDGLNFVVGCIALVTTTYAGAIAVRTNSVLMVVLMLLMAGLTAWNFWIVLA